MTDYDVFLADCPARTTLELVADTWSVVVVFGLGRGPQRYSDLRARIGGISKKMSIPDDPPASTLDRPSAPARTITLRDGND